MFCTIKKKQNRGCACRWGPRYHTYKCILHLINGGGGLDITPINVLYNSKRKRKQKRGVTAGVAKLSQQQMHCTIKKWRGGEWGTGRGCRCWGQIFHTYKCSVHLKRGRFGVRGEINDFLSIVYSQELLQIFGDILSRLCNVTYDINRCTWNPKQTHKYFFSM